MSGTIRASLSSYLALPASTWRLPITSIASMNTVRRTAATQTKGSDASFLARTWFKGVPMLDTELRSLARGFRARAEEILLRTETMRDVDVCLKLGEIAAS